MRKTIIKVCFCFLDRAVWFINRSSLLPYWFLNSKVKNEDDTTNDDEHFILERRISNDNFIFKQTIVCSCMDCFRFQVSISSDENFSCLSNVDCRFVKKDLNLFDDTFNDDIFVGDYQFVLVCCLVLIFIFAFVFCKSVDSYLQRRQYQQIANEIDKLLISNRFLTVIKNGSKDAVDKQLHTDSTKKIQPSTGQI